MKKIGIRLSDGSFYPILDRNDKEEKEIVLTTIKDNQRTVKVDLYVSDNNTIEGATHLDTLQITNLRRHPNGDPSIVLKMRMEGRNILHAEIHDRETGLLSQVTISLTRLKRIGPAAPAAETPRQRGVIEPPNVINERKVEDFSTSSAVVQTETLEFSSDESEALDLQEPETRGALPLDFTDFSDDTSSIDTSSISKSEENVSVSETYTSTETTESKTISKGRIAMWICIICALICIIAVLLFLFFFPSRINVVGGSEKTTETTTETVVEKNAIIEKGDGSGSGAGQGGSLGQSMAAREDEVVVIPQAELVYPDLPRTERRVESREVSYRVKWGDTLWDLASAYYKNPWLYPKIARYNNIKNPNLIIAGTYINIPDVVSY